MQVFVRRCIAAFWFSSLYLAPLASAVTSECGILINLPAGVQVIRDSETNPPLCQLIQDNGSPTPFVNRISRVPWSFLEGSKASGEYQNMSFFKVKSKGDIKFDGRKSYADHRTGYAQIALSKPLLAKRVSGAKITIIARSRLRVTWLKPVDESTQEEITEQFDCVDAAISEPSGLVLINWCAKKGAPEIAQIAKAVHGVSLSLQ